jgi:hypothetical protein
MQRRPIWLGISVWLTAAVVVACSGHDARPPLALGVRDEAALSDVLVDHAMSRTDANCVASHAFEARPKTGTYPDGSYNVTRAMLVEAGVACGIDWSNYDFNKD